ncbi:MAG: redoxin domain-containing protein [Polyangiaceae bacterium]
MKLLRSRFLPRVVALLGFSGVLLVTAMTGCDVEEDPVCGNGKIEAGEACDGAAFGAASCADFGFDGGELTCSASCTVDSSTCAFLDEDGDGLHTDEEAALGTDPLAADTDLDGFTDFEESSNASDPLSINSWPVALQRFPNRLAQFTPSGGATGWKVGSEAKEVAFTDQYGNPLSLHQLYGYNVVMTVGARWCPPCNEAAKTSQAMWTEFADQGVVFVEVLLDGYTQGKQATLTDIQGWSKKYGIQFPVAFRSGTGATLDAAVSALPTYFFIDRTMKVTKVIEGFPGDGAIKSAVKKLAAQ